LQILGLKIFVEKLIVAKKIYFKVIFGLPFFKSNIRCKKMDYEPEGEVVHQGWLTKSPPLETKTRQLFTQTLIQPKWRRRWFQLRQGAMPGQFVLQYYVDQTGKKLKGSIDLDQCEQVDSGLTFECGKIKFQYMFDIRTPRRVYYLAADSEEDMSTWVDLVCRVCGLHNYTQESGGESTGNAQVVTKQPQAQQISGPYMHLSECFTGSQSRSRSDAGTVATLSSRVTTQASLSNSILEDSIQCGDDSVFLPSTPTTAVAAASQQLSQLNINTAAAPGRPPKPANLRNTQISYPSQHSDNDNYENHDDLTHSNNTKVAETNNNCDTNNFSNSTFIPPTVDRRLKPERQVLSNSQCLTTGPPVERTRKPRGMSDSCATSTYPGHSMTIPQGMSIPGDNWENVSNYSDDQSVHHSSDEQIYFYMPSLQTQNMSGKWDPIIIPASELRDNAVQYLDLDLPVTDSSFVEPGNQVGSLSDRSGSMPKGPRVKGAETVYKTVDFVKTEAFNRTRQKVEEYKYNIKQDK